MNQPDAPRPVVPPAEAAAEEAVLGRCMLRGVQALAQLQLPTGGMPSYRRGAQGGFHYCRSLLISTFVHDALACLDPDAPAWIKGDVPLGSDAARSWILQAVSRLRRGIRRFLAWQQEPDGRARFFGRCSRLDSDVDTSACVATALLEKAHRLPREIWAPRHETREGPPARDRWARQFEVVQRFRSSDGRFYTFVTPDGRGYGWLDEHGRPVVGFDRVVQADVLRYLMRIGAQPEADRLVEELQGEAAHMEAHEGTALYPNPLSFYFAVSRAWHQGGLDGLDTLAGALEPRILSLQTEHGDFGGPLSNALAGGALLNLGLDGPPLEQVRRAILRTMQPTGTWAYEEGLTGGFGSFAWTTALSLMVLARCYANA